MAVEIISEMDKAMLKLSVVVAKIYGQTDEINLVNRHLSSIARFSLFGSAHSEPKRSHSHFPEES